MATGRAFGGLVGVALSAGVAHGSIIVNLSTHSSDSTPASVLLATLEFTVSGSNLTLQVTNNTAAPNGYDINQIFFSAGPALTALLLTAPPVGWNLQTAQMADGFGVFDFALIDGVGNDPAAIPPGSAVTFQMTMTGTTTEAELASEMSTNGFIAAAKFITGPGDDSAFGATNVPTPGAAALALVGLGALARRRRR
jgi:uncharacterized protein (TIGR03382 family)